MYKWIYDRMVEEYEKEEKIDLIHKIMSYSNIELADRCFADSFCIGMDVYNINTLFELLENRLCPQDHELISALNSAIGSFNNIKRGLSEMRRATRASEAEKNFKERILEAKDPYDSI